MDCTTYHANLSNIKMRKKEKASNCQIDSCLYFVPMSANVALRIATTTIYFLVANLNFVTHEQKN